MSKLSSANFKARKSPCSNETFRRKAFLIGLRSLAGLLHRLDLLFHWLEGGGVNTAVVNWAQCAGYHRQRLQPLPA